MPTDTVVFDRDGDLELIVGGQEDIRLHSLLTWMPDREKKFLVCSRTLSRASPVFKAMLNGPFKEARPRDARKQGDWTIELPADGPSSMEILMHAVHSKNDKVPATLALRPLYCLLVVANKYDMTHIIRPWANQWFNAREQKDMVRDSRVMTQDVCLAISIAWELGAGDVYREALRVLGRGSRVAGTFWPFHYLQPFGIQEQCLQYRNAIVAVALRELRVAMLGLENGINCCDFSPLEKQRCNAVFLGNIHRRLGSPDWEAVASGSPEMFPWSFLELMAKIRTIDGAGPVTLHPSSHLELYTAENVHEKCNPIPDVIVQVGMLTDTLPDVSKECDDYMSKQREKTGYLLQQ